MIGLLRSDDSFAARKWLAKIARLLEGPAIDDVYGEYEYISTRPMNLVIRYWKSERLPPRSPETRLDATHPKPYLRREVFDTLGLHDTHDRIAADYDAIPRYFGKCGTRLGYEPRPLYELRPAPRATARSAASSCASATRIIARCFRMGSAGSGRSPGRTSANSRNF